MTNKTIGTEKRKIHEAIIEVLVKYRKNNCATKEDIAKEINKRKLYVNKKNTPMHPDIVYLQTRNYSKFFNVGKDGIISLKEEALMKFNF